MNPQWNTPPDGDFARYVERLAEQALQPPRPPQEGEHGLDVGMTQRSDASPAHRPEVEARPASAGTGLGRNLFKALGFAWLLALMVLLAADAPFGIVLGLFAAGLWLGYKLKHHVLPPGVENWKQWLEEAAKRQQQLQQQRKRDSK
ncbi:MULTISPECIES: hypothetical protein [unclassified Variovorax]|uniref:hypothetical protein n=1 Tax=unclassified Variovorax TaxID=663243 RepID=UPI00076DA3EA|nr:MULTISPECIES: hypothetical protein [unclassified Variovorax]KWT83644.1 hypothetical protein APY03_4637 [Variovorax sp. WDL1]PNG52090.1 hypothetical protein CHC07_04461 [Variovorax sp. B4]PNG54630.1 hypothetical protein CHC06_03427 [Variovorax sp. B2]VTV15611.1 hypothetical protein WDL1CHR_06000 [Variovorax sp. WDL1]